MKSLSLSTAIKAYAIALVLVTNMVAPAIAGLSSEENNNRVLLCTSSGYQWVELEPDNSSTPDSESQHYCTFCLNIGDDGDDAITQHPFGIYYQSTAELNRYSFTSFSAPAPSPRAQSPPTFL